MIDNNWKSIITQYALEYLKPEKLSVLKGVLQWVEKEYATDKDAYKARENLILSEFKDVVDSVLLEDMKKSNDEQKDVDYG